MRRRLSRSGRSSLLLLGSGSLYRQCAVSCWARGGAGEGRRRRRRRRRWAWLRGTVTLDLVGVAVGGS